ncbi:MAG: fumarylacetoacetate hydrolase family protein [Propionibacteriaceae bacterium]|jgi:2-keto-4-pentenoate hydratase/2-oxohepta-3-ene-1,7-dioic acid hydratase in catechol pathway|nr:fumarylacetoacetate hydrolase family protein [Propionibacteriaceae bacterium]
MRIARYSVEETIRYGVVELAGDGGANPETVSDLTGDPFSGPVKLSGVRHGLADVRLLAPVLPRSKVIGIAKNSVPGQDVAPAPTTIPAVFLKPNTSVIGPGEAIQLPALSTDPALEAELAIVIGRICRSVTPERVPEVIFGYTVTNDVTARDLMPAGVPWGVAKSWDTFTPLGPWIVTHLSVEEASSLAVTGLVDGECATRGTTRGLIHGIAELVVFVSSIMTLLPGDVILTGAPAGSAPIRAGQTVTIEVEEVGQLTNPVIGEAA